MAAGPPLAALDAASLAIPFTTRFAHASAARDETAAIVVTVRGADGVVGVGEGCPRPYVTGETVDSALAFVAAHRSSLLAVTSLGALRAWMAAHAEAIDRHPAAFCAVELALLDLIGRTAGRPLETLLDLPLLSGVFQYSAVLGDMAPEAFGRLAARYDSMGFRDFKVKLSGDLTRDRARLATLPPIDASRRLRVDANNLWPDVETAVRYLRALDAPLFAVEEPLAPAGRLDELAELADALALPVVVDESVATVAAVADLTATAARWLINLRVSKMGGVLRALDVVDTARGAGLGIIVGAQVGETSRLTRAGLAVAHAAGELLVAQEGAFGTLLLTRDVCEPPLMFGAGGRLDVAAHPRLLAAGLGIEP
ncbi:MAG: mandelate racemase/muconate lactonizing enzyme family protein [Vicinamibacterales bacterium]